MNIKKIAYFLIFSLVFGFSSVAQGATDDTRYLVKSNSGFWKKSFGVRHEFKDGFTSDLTEWQLRVVKVFGVDAVPVQKIFILAENADSISAVSNDQEKDKNSETEAKPSKPTTPQTRLLPSDQLPWGIEAIYGNNPLVSITSGGKDVNIAVLDTGVFADHTDLKRRISQCKDFTAAKQPVVDGKCEDKNGHGTHVSGIILADGGSDNKGIYGVAPESNLFSYKVCGANGSCWSDDIATAIKTAADQGANIINLSLGSDTESSLIKDSISYAVSKNVLIIAAAGNDGPDAGSIDYPGANPDAVAVGAFDINFDIADWSSRGVNSTTTANVIEQGDIEFAAPGVIVESTWKDGGYVILSGTSMATCHITGLAAKLGQKDAEDPDSATRNLLKTFSGDLIPPVGEDDNSGYGFPHL